jgi:hypothetical protein
METMKAKENAGFLHTQEVRGSSPCAPTTLQGYSTSRATHVLPRTAHNPCFLDGFKCQQDGDFEAFRGRDDARLPDRLTTSGLVLPASWMCSPFVDDEWLSVTGRAEAFFDQKRQDVAHHLW